MKQVDFKNGKIFGNVMQSVLPMLVAQVLSLLYSIVDRIYIGRIPGEGTSALGGPSQTSSDWAVRRCAPSRAAKVTGGAPVMS